MISAARLLQRLGGAQQTNIHVILERDAVQVVGKPFDIKIRSQLSRLNSKLRGWAGYFRLGTVSKAYRAVHQHTCRRLRRWMKVKHQAPGRATTRYPDEYLQQTLGLIRLPDLTRTFPWAKACAPRQ